MNFPIIHLSYVFFYYKKIIIMLWKKISHYSIIYWITEYQITWMIFSRSNMDENFRNTFQTIRFSISIVSSITFFCLCIHMIWWLNIDFHCAKRIFDFFCRIYESGFNSQWFARFSSFLKCNLWQWNFSK